MEKPALLPSPTVQPLPVTFEVSGLPVVDVLGVPVACTDRQGIIDFAVNGAQRNLSRTILYVNAHCLNIASQDPEYHKLLNRANLVYSDGIGVVWAARFLSGERLNKVTGADWIFDFCENSTSSGLRLYFLAGRPGIVARAKECLQSRWPGLQIVGCADGYFHEKSEAQVLEELVQTRPHVLLVGMGTPNQEKWIYDHRDQISVPVCWAVGALFDYVAGVERRAPPWIIALALEWFWRLLVDPFGKWRRYIFGNPVFIFRILKQKWLQNHQEE